MVSMKMHAPYREYARLVPFSLSLPCPSVHSSGPRALSVSKRKLSFLTVYSSHVLCSDHGCQVIKSHSLKGLDNKF